MEETKNGRKILLTIGWLSAIFALGVIPVFLGPVAICIGVVLRRDYDSARHGKMLISAGIIGGVVGFSLGFMLV
ncbi:hypothetical protein [Salimicrobium flavidum]|uniref:Uncharacterized protein n=1 Tax=Salimicrobium flavidum TaxID=570947 RepID=A0A1N7J8T6_9BACI|nr:hypothetical protein [Salimicrobium flavidum]SIS45681.1 hypothetical protein SAMN05421687_104151 [Salimicrobium flavidum]